MKVRISLRIEDRERYIVHLNKGLYLNPRAFIWYVWTKFVIQEKPNFVILIEPATVVTSLSQIENNDRWRLIQLEHIPHVVQEEINIRNRALDERAKLIVSGQWQEMRIKNKPKIKENNFTENKFFLNPKFEDPQENPFYIIKRENPERPIYFDDWGNGYGFKRWRLIIQKPKKLKETSINDLSQNGEIQIITPDFEDFWSSILHVSSRRELAQTVKLIAMMHGFRLIVPSGNRRELRSTFRCNRSRSRKTPTQLNRTNCPFAMIYSQVEGKPNYQLWRYRNIHNHPLDEFDMYIGIEVLHKVLYIVSELKKIKQNALELLQKAEEEIKNDDKLIPSEFDLDREVNQLKDGDITVDKMTVLQPNYKSAWNSKIIQIDSLWKALTFAKIEDGDIVNPEKEGSDSKVNWTGVYLSSKDFPNENLNDMKPRRLILEISKQFEKEMIEEYYPQFITMENVEAEDEKFRVKQNIDVFESINLSEAPNTPHWSHEIKLQYNKLDRIPERISPYRIYDVPDFWDDNVDGCPLDLLIEYMPVFIMNENQPLRYNEDDESESDEGEKSDKDLQLTQKSKPSINEQPKIEEDNSDNEDEKHWADYESENSREPMDDIEIKTIEEAKIMSDSIDILSEVMQEIKDDIDGQESISNNNLKKSSPVSKKTIGSNNLWGIKRLWDTLIGELNVKEENSKSCLSTDKKSNNFENSLKSQTNKIWNNKNSNSELSKFTDKELRIAIKRQKVWDDKLDILGATEDSFKDISFSNYNGSVYKSGWNPLAVANIFNN